MSKLTEALSRIEVLESELANANDALETKRSQLRERQQEVAALRFEVEDLRRIVRGVTKPSYGFAAVLDEEEALKPAKPAKPKKEGEHSGRRRFQKG